jgi:hypothetical protein
MRARVIRSRVPYTSHAELLHHRQHVDDSPLRGHQAVLVEPHDVDQLHVDAPAGRGHAHQLTPVSSGRSHARDDHVTGGQNVFGIHPQIGKRRAVHAKELKDSALVGSWWTSRVWAASAAARTPSGSGVVVLAAIRSRSVIDRSAASYALTVAPAIARGTRRAAVSLLVIGTSEQI